MGCGESKSCQPVNNRRRRRHPTRLPVNVQQQQQTTDANDDSDKFSSIPLQGGNSTSHEPTHEPSATSNGPKPFTWVTEPSADAIARARERTRLTGDSFRKQLMERFPVDPPAANPQRAIAKVARQTSPSRRTEAILKGHSMSTSSSGGNPLLSNSGSHGGSALVFECGDHLIPAVSPVSPYVEELLLLCQTNSEQPAQITTQ